MQDSTPNWEFFLFVSKESPTTEHMVSMLEKMCETHLNCRCSIAVIDVILQPDIALQENILATPTLLKKSPEPSRRIIGDLSDEKKLLAALDILPGE